MEEIGIEGNPFTFTVEKGNRGAERKGSLPSLRKCKARGKLPFPSNNSRSSQYAMRIHKTEKPISLACKRKLTIIKILSSDSAGEHK